MEQELNTLQEAIAYFSDPVNCREYVVARRWPNGVVCPTCGSNKVKFQESTTAGSATAIIRYGSSP